ncbi:hypothetical protein [Nocardia sp. NPDC050413]|uniref:hypothetical protein n=1 Tax=Nocardia sp. NPDC050413 TaxID=3155784 RepID=UPI0033DB36A5
MNHGPSVDEYPRLPGPARFIQDVAADLSEGRSAVLVFPDAAVTSGLADVILDDLSREGYRAEFCAESSEAFPTRVLTTFGADLTAQRHFEAWETVISWEAWHGSWVFVPGWRHKDVAEIVDRWPAQLNACGLAIEDRPKLVIAVRLSDLPRKKITHLDPGRTVVHWWWGVLDRLDSETRLAAVARRHHLTPVDASVITEVAGWDLACIDHLAESWDRSTTALAAVLTDYQDSGIASTVRSAETSAIGRGKSMPPAALEQAWSDGRVERWGHSIRWAPHTLDVAEVERRVWLAHNRTLIPYVDEERARYERMIRPKATPQALAGLDFRDDDIIEIGSLKWLVESGHVDIGREDKRRLRAFGILRNNLAHRRPVPDALLQEIVGYLDF